MGAPRDGGRVDEAAHASGGSDTAPIDPPPAARDPAERRLRRLASFGIGIAAGVLGLVPWLLTGMRLPLQNLWATEVAPDSMPITLLPLSQYAVTLITGLIVTGSAVAGLVARLTRERRRRGGLLAIVLGVLLVHAAAGVQSTMVVADGIEQTGRGRLYLAAVIAVVLVSIALGVLVLLLEAQTPAPGATVGFSIGALAVGVWLNSLVAPFGSLPPAGAYELLSVTNWVPPILVGAAIAWCGFSSTARIAADLAALLILWIGASAITAVSAAAGTRILAPFPLEMLDYGIGVFTMRAGMPELVLPPLAVAVVVGVVGFYIVRVTQRRRRPATAGASADPAEPASRPS